MSSTPWWKNMWVRLAIAAVLLTIVIRQIEFSELAALSGRLQWSLVAGALALQFLNRFLTTFKWRVLLRAKGFDYPYFHLLSVVWMSNFMGHFLPSAVGGDNVRMLTLAHQLEPPKEACNTWRALLTGLRTLGADLMEHIELENSLLFE